MRIRVILSILLGVALVARASAQEDHSHHHGEAESLGKVNFPVSCSEAVRAGFTRAVALLHSFGYEDSREAFAAVAAKDPECGMASWGVAMTYYHPIWAAPTANELAAGRAAAEKAAAVGAKTERERGYIAAIGVFYRDSDRLDHRTRALAYKSAMEDLARRFPDDHEASIFYALMLLGTAPPSDATYANQKKAAEILNGLLDREPQHPGVTHYVIHSFDYPALASLALPAARSYAKIAPSSPHALHMPSHIFTRLGHWQESIESNLASADTARRRVARVHPGKASFDALHALDYLEYAYLQIGDEAKAKQVLDEAAQATAFDEGSFAAGYALAAIPARYALERRRWQDAAKLEPSKAELSWDKFSYASAITPFAQALGAARSGQPERAGAALSRLEEIHAGLVKSPIPGPYDWASQVESMRLAAAAWIAFAGGRKDEALSLARSAADLEDKTGKHPVTPGAVLPARELLGDMLLEMKRPSEALVEYEASLRIAPNRLNGLYGAGRSAELSGDSAKARALYAKLMENLGDRKPQREGIQEARSYLAKASNK
jgi:tetratricopeptide (TPR) repeat protein